MIIFLLTVSGGIWPKNEHNKAFMAALVTCKDEEDPIKNEGTIVLGISPVISQLEFLDAQWKLTLQSMVEKGQHLNTF